MYFDDNLDDYLYNKTELLSLDTFTWTASTDYPFHRFIRDVPTLYYKDNDSFYVIGCGAPSYEPCDEPRLIAKFNSANGGWKRAGTMVNSRLHYNAIIAGDKLMIFGDEDRSESEICEEKEEDCDQLLSCSLKGPTLEGSESFAALFLLDHHGRLTFRYNDISIQLHLDTRTFRYGPKVSKCQKNLIQMSKDPNVRNHVSKCQKYPNTQCRIEMSKINVSKCQKYPNVRILSIEMSKGSKCQFLS